MKNTPLLVVMTTFVLLFTSVADAATREEKRVADAADVLPGHEDLEPERPVKLERERLYASLYDGF